MFETFFSPRAIQRVLALTVVLGTLTLVALTLGVLYLTVLLLKTIVDCVLQIVTTVAEVLTIGGPFVRLLFVFLLLFLAWKAAPCVLAFVRRELARVSPLFTAFTAGTRPAQEDDEGEQDRPGTIYGNAARPGVQDQDDTSDEEAATGSPFTLDTQDNEAARRATDGHDGSTKRQSSTGSLLPRHGLTRRAPVMRPLNINAT